jgi:hypothetical protein
MITEDQILTVVVENTTHTIGRYHKETFLPESQFYVLEFCPILEEKEQVKHPSFKKKILKQYDLI